MPQPPRPFFGDALKAAISNVSHHQKINVEIVEENLAIQISEKEKRTPPLTYHAVQRWKRGFPPNANRLEFIIEFCLQYGRPSRDMMKDLLIHAGHNHMLPILDHLYGQQAPRSKHPSFSPNLPNIYGREQDIAQLLKLLNPEHRSAVIVIYGLGGIGKTTLAKRVGQVCTDQVRTNFSIPYDVVVFTSARDQPLTFANILDAIGRSLEYPAVLSRQSVDDKLPIVHDLLKQFQVLLIIDNFETVTDTRLIKFALEDVPAPSKVLITTRDYHHSLWQGTWSLHLRGLNDQQALHLVRQWAQERDSMAILKASDKELEPLLRLAEGNPYALSTSLGIITFQKQSLEAVLQDLWSGQGDIFDHIFSLGWSLLEQSEQQLLLVMSYFVAPATREAISTAANVKGHHLNTSLGRLVELSFLTANDEPSPRYTIHPLIRQFICSKLQEIPQFEEQSRQYCLDFYLHYVEQYGDNDLGNGVGNGGVGYRQKLRDEIDNIRAVIEWSFIHQPPKAVRLVERITTFLLDEGEWAERLTMCKRALPQATTPESKAGLLIRLGWSHVSNGDYKVAQTYQEEALHITQQQNLHLRHVQALRDLGWTHSAQGNYTQALELYHRSLALAEAHHDQLGILLAKAFRARTDYDQGNILESKRDFLALLPAFKSSFERDICFLLRYLVRISLSEKNFEDAYRYLQEAFESLNSFYYEVGEQAELYEIWGDLEKATGDLTKARSYYHKALYMMTHLGGPHDSDRLQSKLAEVE